jgi:hypothetical protein
VIEKHMTKIQIKNLTLFFLLITGMLIIFFSKLIYDASNSFH